MSKAAKNRNILKLYLAFLEKEACQTREILGGKWLTGPTVIYCARVNMLFKGDVRASVIARAKRIINGNIVGNNTNV